MYIFTEILNSDFVVVDLKLVIGSLVNIFRTMITSSLEVN